MSSSQIQMKNTNNLEVVSPESLDSVLRAITKGVSTSERETLIRKSQAEDYWTITTDDPVIARRLAKRYTCYRTPNSQLIFTVPLHCVSFRQLEKRKGHGNGFGHGDDSEPCDDADSSNPFCL